MNGAKNALQNRFTIIKSHHNKENVSKRTREKRIELCLK